MRIATLTKLGTIEVVDGPVPVVENDNDVQVQVKAVGVCGTDLHMFREARADVTLPRIMGHELAGLVTAVGKNVTRVKVGDHVTLDPVFACGECPTCKKGYTNVCANVRCYGVQMDGGYQDYIVVGQEHLYPYDPSISYEEAALAEPFSIAVNILTRLDVNETDNLLILGGGTIGLAVLQMAKSLGARVMVSDVIDQKLSIALDMGADAVINSKTGNLEEAVEAFAPGGFDAIVDAVGITPIFESAFSYAAPRARVACIGFDARPAQIPPVWITKRELSVIGSRMNCGRFPAVMEILNQRKIAATKMISRRYSIDQIQQAFEETLADSAGSIKTMITFD